MNPKLTMGDFQRFSMLSKTLDMGAAVQNPLEYLTANHNPEHPLNGMLEILSHGREWTDGDRAAMMLMLVNAMMLEKAKEAHAASEGAETASLAAITVSAANNPVPTPCPMHGGALVEPGTACQHCIEDAVSKRPEGMSADEARECVLEGLQHALMEDDPDFEPRVRH